jgi:RNA polymerase sigma factor (sigma-70 family)
MSPKDPNSGVSAHLLTELLDLRPDIERLLADEPRSSRRFCANLEDNVQTVFLKVIQHLPEYRPHEDGLKPWVTRIACNLKHDAHRSKQRREQTFGDTHVDAEFVPATSLSPERAAQVQALLSRLSPVIAEMPPQLQEVLIFSALGGMSHAEIACKLDISEDAAKMRLLRAREYIRKRVGTIDDHIGVVPSFWSRVRRTMTVFGQITHLLPPIFVSVSALLQWESEGHFAQSRESVIVVSTHESTTHMAAPNPVVAEKSLSVITPTRHSPEPQKSPKSGPVSQRKKFDVVLPPTTDLMSDRR